MWCNVSLALTRTHSHYSLRSFRARARLLPQACILNMMRWRIALLLQTGYGSTMVSTSTTDRDKLKPHLASDKLGEGNWT